MAEPYLTVILLLSLVIVKTAQQSGGGKIRAHRRLFLVQFPLKSPDELLCF